MGQRCHHDRPEACRSPIDSRSKSPPRRSLFIDTLDENDSVIDDDAARARSPSIALKSSLAPDRFKPRDAPIRMSGIVKMMMSVSPERIELPDEKNDDRHQTVRHIEEKRAVCFLACLHFAADGPLVTGGEIEAL